MLIEDGKDILQAFVDERVRFLLVGAYALAARGRSACRDSLRRSLRWMSVSLESPRAISIG
jgi:hypothetical protein